MWADVTGIRAVFTMRCTIRLRATIWLVLKVTGLRGFDDVMGAIGHITVAAVVRPDVGDLAKTHWARAPRPQVVGHDVTVRRRPHAGCLKEHNASQAIADSRMRWPRLLTYPGPLQARQSGRN